MKKMRKLLRLCLVVVLVFCSLSAGMTVSAKHTANRDSDVKAIKSIKIGGKNVDWSDAYYPEVCLHSKKATVNVKLKKGWKLTKITYYNGKKTVSVKNGGTIQTKKNYDSYVRIKSAKGKKKSTIEISVYRE